MWDNIKAKIAAFFKKSETIVVARLTSIGGALMAIWTQSADPLETIVGWFNSVPALQQYVQDALSPKAIPFYAIGLGLLVEWARRRNDPNLGK